MTSLESENKKQSNNTKEGTGKFLDQQRQQIENTASNISDTSNKVTNSVNDYQQTNRAILDKSIDASNTYQQETIKTIQSISNNTIELQKNFANTFQSVFSKFINDTSKSYWNNYLYPQRYTDIYNKTNQNVTDNTLNTTRRINNIALASTETLNKSIEIAQKYYNESVQNYFNFVNKIEKSY
jgi:ABC-type transporter Mla subunit MlaD